MNSGGKYVRKYISKLVSEQVSRQQEFTFLEHSISVDGSSLPVDCQTKLTYR